MTIRRFALAALLLSYVLLSPGTHAQPRGLADQGYVGLGMALRQLSTVGTFMQAVAHPDDENNGLLVMLKRGQGIRTVLATATRGDGGQNEIGPELSDALGVLRTAELMSMHRFDGAEQYFTRAVDFGYSFSLEETFQRWGKDEIVGDYVRLIRTIRPDVIMTMSPEGTGGGQHHQASARIVAEAFRAAADPARYPEQMKEGLRPWQAGKLYYSAGFGGGRGAAPQGADVLRIDNEVWDPLLGATYAFIGSESRSMHKCQGMGQMLALPGPSVFSYRLGDSAGRGKDRNAALFDGIDSTLASLAQHVRGTPPPALQSALDAIASAAGSAQKAFSTDGPAATIQPLVDGLGQVRALRASLPQMAGIDDGARYEIDFRLKTKERQFEDAVILAEGLQFDVVADDGQVVAGQTLSVRNLIIANRGGEPVELKAITFEGLDGDPRPRPGTIAPKSAYRWPAQGENSSFRVSPGVHLTTPYWKRLPDAARYEFEPDVPFGVPFRPTPFKARIQLGVHGSDVTIVLPVQYRYEGNVFSGEKRMELQVIPAFSVRVTPDITIVPAARPATTSTSQTPEHLQASTVRQAAAGQRPGSPNASATTVQTPPVDEREVRVSVANGTRGAIDAEITLQTPAGWRATPPSTKVSFAREDEVQTVRFRVKPAKGTAVGAYRMKAIASMLAKPGGGAPGEGVGFDQGYRVIEYQHIEHQQMIEAAETTVKLIDVKVRPHLLVGYVMGVGDQVLPAIEQLGAQVNLLTSDDLAWGNLSRYDAIVTGVRAYERREDLREHNQRLLDYVHNGGTLVVQYNKTEFNRDPSGRPTQYGPYPAQVSNARVTDENAPAQVLQPQNPIFNAPNKIGPAAWQGWVQERGLYFLGEKDPRYVDLIQMEDPFSYNAGAKRGALVEASDGKGHWIYVGLNLWRQLPAGTDGAYQLLANLISLGAQPAAAKR
jgi:LmbE family N-acetylglucosaminyl deacetylase